MSDVDANAAAGWLREQIEGDLRAAKIVSDGGFEPERWDTLPPGQVNPEVIGWSGAIDDALGLDEEERPSGWVAIYAWNRLSNEPPEADSLEFGAPVALVDGGRRQFDHIRRQDPRNTVARREAELAILDLHEDGNELRHGHWEGYGSNERWVRDEPDECPVCPYQDVPCPTVRMLASGYRHRPGYAAHWGEGG